MREPRKLSELSRILNSLQLRRRRKRGEEFRSPSHCLTSFSHVFLALSLSLFLCHFLTLSPSPTVPQSSISLSLLFPISFSLFLSFSLSISHSLNLSVSRSLLFSFPVSLIYFTHSAPSPSFFYCLSPSLLQFLSPSSSTFTYSFVLTFFSSSLLHSFTSFFLFLFLGILSLHRSLTPWLPSFSLLHSLIPSLLQHHWEHKARSVRHSLITPLWDFNFWRPDEVCIVRVLS